MQMRSGRVGNWNYYWHSMRRFVPQLQEGRHVQAEWGSWDYPYPSTLYIKPKAHNLLLLLLSISSSIIGSMEILCARKMTCSHRSFYQSLHPSLGAWDPLCQENYMLTSKLLCWGVRSAFVQVSCRTAQHHRIKRSTLTIWSWFNHIKPHHRNDAYNT